MTNPLPSRSGRTYWLDYLRGFITVLVVAHHSSLAYTTFARFNPQAYNASTHPVVDTARAFGLDNMGSPPEFISKIKARRNK